VARYGLIFWVPAYFLGRGWRDDPANRWLALSLPVGMAFGALVNGQLSDRMFGQNRSRPIALFLALGALVSYALAYLQPGQFAAGLVLLFLAGFLVYGPQSSFWALCPDLLGRRRAGTGVGVMDFTAYLFAGIGEVVIGQAADAAGHVGVAFPLVGASCALGAVLILFVRR
jgi:OPA family glycerol-3-phosphate transporter-like MFS transporter